MKNIMPNRTKLSELIKDFEAELSKYPERIVEKKR
jgi:hypothetical protein